MSHKEMLIRKVQKCKSDTDSTHHRTAVNELKIIYTQSIQTQIFMAFRIPSSVLVLE